MATYHWEVIVARNVDPPYRYSQEYLWLDLRAPDQLAAVEQAKAWAWENGYEATDMVRLATKHESHYGYFPDGQPAEIFWHLPIVSDMPPGAMVRHPVTGFRVGYLAGPEDEQAFSGDLQAEQLRLIIKKPSPGSAPLGLAPIVSSLQYSFAAQQQN